MEFKYDKLFVDGVLFKEPSRDWDIHGYSLRILSWDVEGLSKDKRSNDDIWMILTQYDIICLSESRTTKLSKVDLSGYRCFHSYRRSKSTKSTKSQRWDDCVCKELH